MYINTKNNYMNQKMYFMILKINKSGVVFTTPPYLKIKYYKECFL